ncbi:MAG: hypothetical protein ACTSYI_14795 [Promethearchaeota archaeon]
MSKTKFKVYNYGKEPEKNTIKHKYSSVEYQQKRSQLQNNLESIQINLGTCLKSPLKVRILEINITNIANAIDYYYNSSTDRELANINKIYRDSAQQIVKLTRFIKTGEETDCILKNVYYHLEGIISDLLEQRNYINQIEQQRHEMNKSLNS